MTIVFSSEKHKNFYIIEKTNLQYFNYIKLFNRINFFK